MTLLVKARKVCFSMRTGARHLNDVVRQFVVPGAWRDYAARAMRDPGVTLACSSVAVAFDLFESA